MIGPPLDAPSETVARLSRLVNDGTSFFLVPGEAWSDAVNYSLSHTDGQQRAAWVAMLTHTWAATAARPSSKWLATARQLIGRSRC